MQCLKNTIYKSAIDCQDQDVHLLGIFDSICIHCFGKPQDTSKSKELNQGIAQISSFSRLSPAL